MKLLPEFKSNDTKRLDLLAQIHFQKKEFQQAYEIYQDLIDRESEFRSERRENVQTLIACAQLEKPGTLMVRAKDRLPSAGEIIDQVQQINLKDEATFELSLKPVKSKESKQNSKKHKKRKQKLPKQYDPATGPDPERWLPRRDRKSNAHRQKKRRQRPNTKGGGGKSRTRFALMALVAFTTFILTTTMVQGYGVMSVDLGSEWMKVGLVAPSVPMDLVLNDQSNRKTSMAIAISDDERSIGDSALDVAIKYPERTFTYFLDLVGKSIDDESVKQYMRKFPYANISSHEPVSSSILLNHPQGGSFTPLELVAMMLQHAKDQVLNRIGGNEPVNDVVITVPPFFKSVETKVIRDAAKVIGLNVLRFTHSNSAFALSYGIFRHKDYLPEDSDNKTSIIFFDQGASHTSVTVADYHLIEQVDPLTFENKNESLPTISIRAQVYDRFLGGFDMQLRLRDRLVHAFTKETKIDPARIYKRGRSASKVLKEAGRVKRVLSANSDFLVRIENVIDDKDLSYPITRREFEDMNEDLLTNRITRLLDQLFDQPNVSRKERFESVIIVGGNTRTPKIQQVLMDYFKLDALGKSVNADEGAALAALYQAASLGRGFRVKKFALEEFGEERVRFDPAKVMITTTTPQPPTTEIPLTTITPEQSADEPSDEDVGITAMPPDETADEPEFDSDGPEESVTTTYTTTTAPTTTAPTTTPTTTTAPTTTLDPEAIYSQVELERMSTKLTKMREDDFARLQQLLELNKRELDEIENERQKNEKEARGEKDEQPEVAPGSGESAKKDEIIKDEL